MSSISDLKRPTAPKYTGQFNVGSYVGSYVNRQHPLHLMPYNHIGNNAFQAVSNLVERLYNKGEKNTCTCTCSEPKCSPKYPSAYRIGWTHSRHSPLLIARHFSRWKVAFSALIRLQILHVHMHVHVLFSLASFSTRLDTVWRASWLVVLANHGSSFIVVMKSTWRASRKKWVSILIIFTHLFLALWFQTHRTSSSWTGLVAGIFLTLYSISKGVFTW